jgi:hypothetical protein
MLAESNTAHGAVKGETGSPPASTPPGNPATPGRGNAMGERLFTLEEANSLIPRLEILMGRLQQLTARLRDELAAVTPEGGDPARQMTAEDLIQARPDLRAALDEMRQLISSIGDCGGEFKGVDLGLIDFPIDINGQVVLLCWQFGEKEIEYYHTREAGFAGRRPLDPDRMPSRPLQ